MRIFYKLDRFSEDLDFSLLQKDNDFDIIKYCHAIKNELQSFGFDVEVSKKEKNYPLG